jgi:hypothetical protein
MRAVRAGLFSLLIVVALDTNIEFKETGGVGIRGALAETKNEGVTTRIGRWTRARLQAAKKHWSEHEQWFSECNRELGDLKKSGKRISYDGQAHFLTVCMRRKH